MVIQQDSEGQVQVRSEQIQQAASQSNSGYFSSLQVSPLHIDTFKNNFCARPEQLDWIAAEVKLFPLQPWGDADAMQSNEADAAWYSAWNRPIINGFHLLRPPGEVTA